MRFGMDGFGDEEEDDAPIQLSPETQKKLDDYLKQTVKLAEHVSSPQFLNPIPQPVPVVAQTGISDTQKIVLGVAAAAVTLLLFAAILRS